MFGNARFFCLVFRGGTVNWLPGSAVMVRSWQMLCGDRSPAVVVVLISRRCVEFNTRHNIRTMKLVFLKRSTHTHTHTHTHTQTHTHTHTHTHTIALYLQHQNIIRQF